MPNKFKILKSISVKLNDTYIMILSYMYRSPDKKLGIKSQYRFECVIDTISNLTEIMNNYSQNPIDDWTWFNNQDILIQYGNLSNNRTAASWLAKRLKAPLSWENFQTEISVPWRNKGWISEGYSTYNNEIENLDLKNITPEFLINKDRLHVVSDKALSISPKYI